MRPEVSRRGLPRWLRLAAAFLVVAPCFASAQAQDSKDDVKTYVGPLAGAPASARLAVVTDGGRVMAYLCSGDHTFNETFSRWFKGSLTRTGDLSAESMDGLTITAHLTDNLLKVTLTVPDQKGLACRARELVPRGIAGLYRAEIETTESAWVYGWLIDQDHDVVGDRKVGRRERNSKGAAVVSKPSPPPTPPPAVTTPTARKRLPPAPVGVITDKQQVELENRAAEVVRVTQGGQIVGPGQASHFGGERAAGNLKEIGARGGGGERAERGRPSRGRRAAPGCIKAVHLPPLREILRALMARTRRMLKV
jgi:hypothetical protein